jgi:hypothetical protein
MKNTTYAYDTSSQSDPMVIASNTNPSQQSFESIQVNASALPVIDGRDHGAFEPACEVILIVAFAALVTLMCRKRKHASRRCYY